jgi:ribA/ribD-fused uncharacterized protein
MPTKIFPAKKNEEYIEDIIPFFSHTKGEYSCFSQFYFSDFTFTLDKIPKKLLKMFNKHLESIADIEIDWSILEDKIFNCAEKFMMSGKCVIFDKDSFEKLYKIQTPAKCKEFGRSNIKNFNATIWDHISIYWVLIGNYLKFTQNKTLAKILKNTKKSCIVEASPYDKIWGIGIGENHPDINSPNKWKGTNKLGEVLMTVRDML